MPSDEHTVETVGDDFTHVSVHEETAALVDELKPEYMSRSAFVDGTVWKFYGHLRDPARGRRLTLEEHRAAYRLKQAGVGFQTIAHAFGTEVSTIRRSVQARDGMGGHHRLSERGGEGGADDAE